MKEKEKSEARKMRKEEGKSVKEIARILGVSSGSVSYWVRDICLTNDQIQSLGESRCKARISLIKNGLDNRLKLQDEGKAMAKRFRSEPLFSIGCSVFWAEGSKSRNSVEFTNSDPDMMKLFLKFLNEYFCVKMSDVSIRCRYYTDLSNVGEPEKYWLDYLGLPDECVRKSCVNYYPKSNSVDRKKYSHGKLRYGVCRLVLHNIEITQKLYGAIQELTGVDKPEWLGSNPTAPASLKSEKLRV